MFERKIFLSYKYMDNDVRALPDVVSPTWPCNYANYLCQYFLSREITYKCNQQDLDLSRMSNNRIEQSVFSRMEDSDMTIVLVSPNMKLHYKKERNQWIPWHVYCSLLKRKRRDGSHYNNAVLALVLPDRNGDYGYYHQRNLFRIMDANIKNDFIVVCKWDDFAMDQEHFLKKAVEYQRGTPDVYLDKRI